MEMDDKLFGTMFDHLFEGLRVLPKLPTISFKKDGYEIEATDFRCLNEAAKAAFEILLNEAAKGETEKAMFDVTGIDKEQVDIVERVIMAAGYHAKKRKNRKKMAEFDGALLVTGCGISHVDGKDILEVNLIRESAEAIHKLAEKSEGVVPYTDVVLAIVKDADRRWHQDGELALE